MHLAPSSRPFSSLLGAIALIALLSVFPASTQDRVAHSPDRVASPAQTVVAAGSLVGKQADPHAARLDPAPSSGVAPASPVTTGAASPRAAVSGPAPPDAASPVAAGLMVGVDPETGKLGMPTPDQRRRLSELERAATDHSGEGLVEEHRPDGTVLVNTQGRFQEFATVRVSKDGKKTFGCVQGEAAAERAMQEPPPAEPTHEQHEVK